MHRLVFSAPNRWKRRPPPVIRLIPGASESPYLFPAVPWGPELSFYPGEGRSWGAATLAFRLPGCQLRLYGLSECQRDALLGTYPAFAGLDCPPVGPGVATCRVYRLPAPPGLPTETLIRDGQYAPRNTVRPGMLEITGTNFTARFGRGDRLGVASLGVAAEHELVQANVIENFLRVYAAHNVLRQGGVVLHSAGLVLDDRGFIFVGRSGAGKTTLTRKAHAAGAGVLSDDINLLLPGDDGYRAFAVPFTGEFGRTLSQAGLRESYPVAGLALLSQGERLMTRPVPPSRAVARLLVGCPFVNTDEDEAAALFDVLGGLVERVPVVDLSCRRDDGIDKIMTALHKAIDHGYTDAAH